MFQKCRLFMVKFEK